MAANNYFGFTHSGPQYAPVFREDRGGENHGIMDNKEFRGDGSGYGRGRGGRGGMSGRGTMNRGGRGGIGGERGERGVRGERGAPRGGYDGRGKREFDRQSGSDKTPTGATPYQTTQPGYAVAPSAAAAAAIYPQWAASAYDTAYTGAAVDATHTQPDVPYAAVQAGTTAPTATYDYAGYAVASSAQPAYDTTKTYCQQQAPAPASYTNTDYPGGGGGKPQYGGGGGGSYSSQAAATAYIGSAVQQQPEQPNCGGGGGVYASATYSQENQPPQPKKQVKKPFHAQSSNAVMTTVTISSSVAAVTSYQTVGGGGDGGNQQAAGGTGVSSNSYTPHQQQTTLSCTSAAAATAKPKTGAIVISRPAAATDTNYDVALYSGATSNVAQQATGGGGGGGNTRQGGGGGVNCNCKISCAGQQDLPLTNALDLSLSQDRLQDSASTSRKRRPVALVHPSRYSRTPRTESRFESTGLQTEVSNGANRCEVFGEFIASEMQRLPIRSSLVLQTKILKLINNERLAHMI